MVINRGDKGENFYLILEGSVVVQNEIENKLISTVELKQGDSFGELALLKEGGVRISTIRTIADCHFAYLSKVSF